MSWLNHKSWIQEIGNVLIPITRMKMKLVIKNLPAQNSQRPHGFIGKFIQILKKNNNLYQNLTNNWIETTHSKSFHEASIILIPKQNKNNTRTKILVCPIYVLLLWLSFDIHLFGVSPFPHFQYLGILRSKIRQHIDGSYFFYPFWHHVSFDWCI